MTDLTAVVDIDYIKYTAASAGETRTIKAYHPIDGVEFEAKTRTELWGHYLKKDKGILAEFNKKNGTDYKADELVVIDLQHPEPVQNILHTAKSMFESLLWNLKTNKYTAYIGKGESWRVGRSTILEYKGNRKEMLKPLLLDDVTEYLIKKYKPEIVEYYESDDKVVMDAYRDKSKVVCGVDKDYLGCDVLVFNPNKVDQGVIDCEGLGSLWLDSKGKVTGKGRIFFYHQVLSGDTSDNYAANSASDIEWGEKSSYKLLKDCQTDKEALAALKKGYQLIYPETKVIKSWKGNDIEVDWKYVLNENWDLARMLRWENDTVIGTDVLYKFGLLGD